MKPSEVRSRILEDHHRIRAVLIELEALAAGGRAQEQASELRDRTRSFLAQLEAHLCLEEQILFPAIQAVDSWGPIRAARLQENHADQRLELGRLASLERQVGDFELCEALRTLSRDLRDDMHREEAELLDPDLLRDDLVAINQFGG